MSPFFEKIIPGQIAVLPGLDKEKNIYHDDADTGRGCRIIRR